MCSDLDADNCVYDTVPCMHNCRGCHQGINECECGSLVLYDDEYCSGCDKKIKKPQEVDDDNS